MRLNEKRREECLEKEDKDIEQKCNFEIPFNEDVSEALRLHADFDKPLLS